MTTRIASRSPLTGGTVKQIDKNEFFRQATLRITGSLEIETALRDIKEYLNQFMPVASLSMVIYDVDKNIGKMVASIRPDNWFKAPETLSFPKEMWEWLKREHSRELREKIDVINDLNQEDPLKKNIIGMIWPTNSSIIMMELELQGQRLGTLILIANGKNKYTDQHVDLISLLNEPFASAMSNILRHQEIVKLKEILEDDNQFLNRQIMDMSGNTIIGADFGLSQVLAQVRQVAPMNSPVLLLGETGAGKEVIANAIHNNSPRRNTPIIKVNCGAIPESLIDSELFGHEKGAFTGALCQKRGRFERAHGGTIFLDEIGELPLPAQVRLLRIFQNMEIERVGGTETIPINVRIITATHRNLQDMIKKGTFREDLWFRLNVFPITIPPLRKRPGDIPALINYFIERKSRELKLNAEFNIKPGTLTQLQSYGWPGNVRELENLVERALIRSQSHGHDNFLCFDSIDSNGETHPTQQDETISSLDVVISSHITKALNQAHGKVAGKNGAAALLGLNPSTLRGKMRKLGIKTANKVKST